MLATAFKNSPQLRKYADGIAEVLNNSSEEYGTYQDARVAFAQLSNADVYDNEQLQRALEIIEMFADSLGKKAPNGKLNYQVLQGALEEDEMYKDFKRNLRELNDYMSLELNIRDLERGIAPVKGEEAQPEVEQPKPAAEELINGHTKAELDKMTPEERAAAVNPMYSKRGDVFFTKEKAENLIRKYMVSSLLSSSRR